jgi:hypothetical protein
MSTARLVLSDGSPEVNARIRKLWRERVVRWPLFRKEMRCDPFDGAIEKLFTHLQVMECPDERILYAVRVSPLTMLCFATMHPFTLAMIGAIDSLLLHVFHIQRLYRSREKLYFDDTYDTWLSIAAYRSDGWTLYETVPNPSE